MNIELKPPGGLLDGDFGSDSFIGHLVFGFNIVEFKFVWLFKKDRRRRKLSFVR